MLTGHKGLIVWIYEVWQDPCCMGRWKSHVVNPKM